jgi:putative transcriptional regulator
MESIIYRFPLNSNINLKPLRAALGLNRTEFAAELGVSFYTVQRWENGGSLVNKSALKLLEQLLRRRGVTSDKFTVSADVENRHNPPAVPIDINY